VVSDIGATDFVAVAGAGAMSNLFVSPLLVTVAFIVAITGAIALQAAKKKGEPAWHRLLEGRALVFTVFAAIAVLVGGIAELVPSLAIKPAEIASKTDVRPYQPLELEGRDVYIREGCYTCHSQMIRSMRFESARYGDVSTMADSMYDHPFQWGSKRSGPDLAREGGKYPNVWHAKHMVNPRSLTEESNMPPYAHLADEKIDFTRIPDKVGAMKAIGVPYTQNDIATAELDAIGLLDGQLGLIGRAHGDERETAGAAGHLVHGDVGVGDGTELLEVRTELALGGVERQVSNVEFGIAHVINRRSFAICQSVPTVGFEIIT